MPFPAPANYPDWASWGAAMVKALGDSPTDLSVGTTYDQGGAANPGGGGGTLPDLPAGWRPLWLSEGDAKLYLANSDYDPPTAPDLFQIDTLNLALAAVTEPTIADFAVSTAKIQNAAIVTALIGDAQIVTAKIANLAVNTAQIANAAVSSAKIANLAVGTAHIQAAAVTNAEIGNIIQSAGWDGTHGWQIDKAGNISGTGITIYNSDGSIAFASGSLVNLATQVTGSLPNGQVTGLGALALLNSASYGSGYLTGFGVLASQSSLAYGGAFLTGFGTLADNNSVNLASAEVTGLLPLVSTSGNIDISRTTGFGSLAAISLLNSGNINTYIAGAAIGSALIANLAVGTAAIDNAAVTTAKIANAAITNALIANLAVDTAQINNLAVTSAKIADLVVDKLTSGQLDASIDVGTGIFSFVAGGSTLYIGNGFGSSGQFFMWFGPSPGSPAGATEAGAVVYLKTNGDAYFGGSIAAGTIRSSITTLDTSNVAAVILGPIGSLGHTRECLFSYSVNRTVTRGPTGSMTFSGTPSVSVVLEKWNGATWDLLDTLNLTGSTITDATGRTIQDEIGGSRTFFDTSGGLTAEYRVRIASLTFTTMTGTATTVSDVVDSQIMSLITTET